MTCGLRKEVIMRKQTRHRFVATNYNRDERHLPFLLYNFYFMRFAQRRKGKLAKTKIFLSLTSGVCFFALIFENYHTIPLAQNEIHLQLQLKSPIQDDGAHMFSFLTCIAPVILAFLPSVRMACKRSLLENLKSKSKILKRSCPACRML